MKVVRLSASRTGRLYPQENLHTYLFKTFKGYTILSMLYQ